VALGWYIIYQLNTFAAVLGHCSVAALVLDSNQVDFFGFLRIH
jgi:hypothetical protein